MKLLDVNEFFTNSLKSFKIFLNYPYFLENLITNYKKMQGILFDFMIQGNHVSIASEYFQGKYHGALCTSPHVALGKPGKTCSALESCGI